MSGHSKWHNIQAKKGKTDAARGKIFTKIGREIAMVVRDGGPNPESNSKLRDVIAKAKANNMPNDNIQRSIKKASGEGSGLEYVELNYEGYADVAAQLSKEFGLSYVATTLRKSISASDNEWSAMLYHNGKTLFSKSYMIHIVNRVGGGDSFSGGLIYGLANGFDDQKSLEFATAASCLKHSIEGDYNLVSVQEVLTLMNGDGSGRVQR